MRRIIATALTGLLCLLADAAPATKPADQSNSATALDVLKRQVALYRDERELAGKKRDELAEALKALRDAIRANTGRLVATPEGLRRVLDKLQEQHEQLELDEAGARGRREGLEKAIAQLSDRLKQRTQSDAVADELKKVVQVREQQLKRVEEAYKSATVAQAEVDSAEAALAQSKADLAGARQRAIGSGSAEALDAWNRELLTLSVEEQERQARLEYIKERLQQLAAVQEQVDDLDRFTDGLRSAEATLAQATERLATAEHQLELEKLRYQ